LTVLFVVFSVSLADDFVGENNGWKATRNIVLQFNPDAKKHHWGKRKLKRDQ